MAIDTHEGKTTKAPTGLERRCVWGGTEGGGRARARGRDRMERWRGKQMAMVSSNKGPDHHQQLARESQGKEGEARQTRRTDKPTNHQTTNKPPSLRERLDVKWIMGHHRPKDMGLDHGGTAICGAAKMAELGTDWTTTTTSTSHQLVGKAGTRDEMDELISTQQLATGDWTPGARKE